LRLFFSIFSKTTFWTYVVYDLDGRVAKEKKKFFKLTLLFCSIICQVNCSARRQRNDLYRILIMLLPLTTSLTIQR